MATRIMIFAQRSNKFEMATDECGQVVVYTDVCKKTAVGTPRCGVPAPCRRGTGASPSDGLVALATECSAAERGGDGAARHPYLCFTAPGRKGAKYVGWLDFKLCVAFALL